MSGDVGVAEPNAGREAFGPGLWPGAAGVFGGLTFGCGVLSCVHGRVEWNEFRDVWACGRPCVLPGVGIGVMRGWRGFEARSL